MDKIGRGLRLAAALAVLAAACIARADDDPPPSHGSRLGLATSHLSDTWREKNSYRSSGVLVVGVDPAGRAGKAGVVSGDVLVSVDGRTLKDPSDLGYAERNLEADRAVAVVLAREGGHSIKMFDIPPVSAGQVAAVPEAAVTAAPDAVTAAPDAVTAAPLAAAADQGPVAANDPPANSVEPAAAAIPPAIIIARGDSAEIPAEPAKPGSVQLGVKGQALTPDLAAALGATGVEGIVVLSVVAESPADHAGVRTGDIIFKIGDQPVKDTDALDSAVAVASSPVSIGLLRLGKQQMVLAPLDGHPEAVTPQPAIDQQQLLLELRDEVKSLRKELQDLRDKIGKWLDQSGEGRM